MTKDASGDIVARTLDGILSPEGPDFGNVASAFDDSQAQLRAALEADPDNAELAALLEQSIQMAALLKKAGAANASGDTESLMAVADKVSDLTGIHSSSNDMEADAEALKDAMEDGDLDRVKGLLASGINLNRHYGDYGAFPLQWVMYADDNKPALMRLLLDAGADATFATSEGYTALHALSDQFSLSTKEETVELAALLLDAGADLEARNHYGWTPVLAAVMEGSVDELGALLQAGGDPNARYPAHSMPVFSRGITALMNAAGKPEKIELLLEYGADPNGVDDHGRNFEAYVATLITENANTQTPLLGKLVTKMLGGGNFERDYANALVTSRDLVAQHARLH